MTSEPTTYVAYVSRAAFGPRDPENRRIGEHARAANAAAGITGFLHREGAHFVQHLEGPGAAVDDLMARIARDRRHGDLRVLPCGEASGRLFAGWSMGFTDARWLTLADTFRCRPARLVHEPAETALRFLSRAAEVAARPGARSASARWRGGRAAGLS